MIDLAARLKAKGYAPHKDFSFLDDLGVPSFSLEGDKTMTDERRQRQRLAIALAEAIEALKAIDPHLTGDGVERSSRARHCIRWVLREMDKLEGSGDA